MGWGGGDESESVVVSVDQSADVTVIYCNSNSLGEVKDNLPVFDAMLIYQVFSTKFKYTF
jgi:hypothetical protein